MQEHPRQVRGQARAPVGRHFGGLAFDWMDRLFPVLSQRHTRTNLPDISTFPEASTQLTHVLVCVCARAPVCGRWCACARPFALAIFRRPSPPLSVPQKKGAMFLLDCEALSRVFLSRPPSPLLPGRRGFVFALTYSSRTLCLDSLGKALVKQ